MTLRTRGSGSRLVFLAVCAAFAGSVLLLFAPITVTRERTGLSVDRDTGAGPARTVVTQERAIDDLSVGTVAFFAVPVVVAALPLAGRRSVWLAVRATSACLLLLWVLFLAFAGGELYLPAFLLMVAAAARAGRTNGVTTAGSRPPR